VTVAFVDAGRASGGLMLARRGAVSSAFLVESSAIHPRQGAAGPTAGFHPLGREIAMG
jgi:hypothetical protein